MPEIYIGKKFVLLHMMARQFRQKGKNKKNIA